MWLSMKISPNDVWKELHRRKTYRVLQKKLIGVKMKYDDSNIFEKF